MYDNHQQKAGKNRSNETALKSSEIAVKFRYFGMTVTYKNCNNEGFKSRRSTYYHSIQEVLFSHLLSRSLNFNI
jgi:hypothetical protein